MVTVQLRDLVDTHRFGKIIGELLVQDRMPLGCIVIGLDGTLGAGKTCLVQSILSGLGVARDRVTSPTFSLIQTYAVSAASHSTDTKSQAATRDWTFNHVDAYRINDEDEFLDLGIEEIVEQPLSVTIIEWAEKVATCLPPETLRIRIHWFASDRREVEIDWRDQAWEPWVGTLVDRFNAAERE
jgi:tRNA threonylcarbamoyladenosine biosynthesis protein TsaE